MQIECAPKSEVEVDSEFLFKSIEKFIASSNFPKKLVVKKLDLYSNQYKDKLKTLKTLEAKVLESCENTSKKTKELVRANREMLRELTSN